MKIIGFFVRHFTERGTEVAIYDYADFNEKILGNRSLIICFSMKKRQQLGSLWAVNNSYEKFKSRFDILELDNIRDIKKIIEDRKLDVFYTLTHGSFEPNIYEFSNNDIWQRCKTIKHSVFEVDGKESDYYCCISDWLNIKNSKNFPVLPHIINLPDIKEDLRKTLNIPQNSIVFGGYGGSESFSIEMTHKAVYNVAENNPSIYFVFANFNRFCKPLPNIIHLPMIMNPIEKVKLINTCDAMIWGRKEGETFGISIGEFSSKNKPVIATIHNCMDIAHWHLLTDKGIWYNNEKELVNILNSFNKDENSKKDWNGYKNYTPEIVMDIFKNILEELEK
jgi:hypothetical protein